MIKKLPFISIFTILHLLTHIQKSYSQNLEITGTIVDATTQEPLPSASVVLFEKSTKKLIEVEVSDTEGKFHFTNLNSTIYLIRIQYIGYQEYITDSLVVSNTMQLNTIHLNPIEQKLSEISITGTKSTIEQNATNTTVNVAESSLATGGSIYEMLQKTPGVSAKDDAISLRGKSLSLLLDGRLVNLPTEEVINLLKSLPASSIEKMELISNPTGKYDGQVQAILNIKTFKPKNDSWEGSVTLSGGTGRKIRSNSSVNFFTKKNKLSTYIGWDYINNPTYSFINRNVELQSTDGTNFFEERKRQTILQYTHALNLNIEYDIHPNHNVGISLRSSINPQRGSTNILTDIRRKNSQQIDSIYNYNSRTQLTLKNIGGNIYYKITFDSAKNKELIINGDYYNYERIWTGDYQINTLLPNQAEVGNPNLLYNSSPLYVSIRAATADYTHTTSFGTWQAGLKTTYAIINNSSIWKKKQGDVWAINPSITDHFFYDEYIQAGYIGFSNQFKKININASLRAEHTFSKGHSVSLQKDYIKKYINLFPTIILEYHPSENHEWIFSYRRGIERPIYQDINPFIRMATFNLYVEGNPSILPSLIHFEEITYGYHQKLFAKIVFRQYMPAIWELLQEIPGQNIMVNKRVNYTHFYEELMTIYGNFSIASWWSINPAIELYFESGKYEGVAAAPISPKVGFSFSSSMSLANNWNIEIAGGTSSSYQNGYVYFGSYYYVSTGIKKSFLEKRLTASLLINTFLPYWYRENYLTAYSEGFVSNDLRYFMLSINYKIGNSKKNNLPNRKSGVEAEKNRLKE